MKELLKNYHKLSEEKKKLVKILLKEQGIDIDSKLILPQEREGNLFPLSFSQQRLWFLEQLQPNSPLYIIPSGVKIIGPVKINYLVKGLEIITKRHEILRTRFVEREGEGFQEVLDEIKLSPIKYDLSNETEPESTVQEIIYREFTKPFDLSKCPLFRIVIIELAEDIKYLLLPMHHIISDNWSTGLLIKELLECYEGLLHNEDPSLPELNIQYVDYTLWQQKWLKSDEIKKQRKYWYNKLIDSNKILETIPDKKRPSMQTYNGSYELFKIDSSLTEKLEQLSKKEGLTIFIIFLAVYQFVLSKYSRQKDINIGVPVANRNHTEIEELIGFFINTLVFRGNIDGTKTVGEFLSDTKKNSLEAYANQDIPFEMVVDDLNLKRDMSHTALFQAMLVVNNAPVPSLKLEGIKFEPLEVDTGNTKFDLVLSFTKNENTYSGKFEFNTDIYKRSTIRGIIENLVFVLTQFVENTNVKLNEIYLSSKDEIYKIIENTNSIYSTDTDSEFLFREFEKIVDRYPDKTAVSDGNNSLTYAELNRRSNIFAHELLKKGIKPERSVGVLLDRKVEYITSVIGILKSGGVYVPLDTEYPRDRLEYIIDDSRIDHIITSDKHAGLIDNFKVSKILIDDVELSANYTENLSVKLSSQNSAYTIYTSGSTGLPKGVIVEHSNITTHIKNVIEEFGITSEDKYLAFASFNFDASIEQIFVPLLCGAEIYLRGNEYWLPNDFIKLINEESITVINPPTVYWNQFVNEISRIDKVELGKLRLVIAGGSEMRTDLLNDWIKATNNKIDLINAYGPTETLITSSLFKAKDKIIEDDCLHTPIGRAIGDRKAFILDEFGNILPPNVPGQLCFSSKLLARGYQNNPRTTADKFIPDNLTSTKSGRLYLTGDLVRYDKSGIIEYLGRIDNQVKVRGYRIELGEIEEVLLDHDFVNDTAVVVNTFNKEDEFIIAYVIVKNTEIEASDLIKFCKEKLPGYMVPNHIMFMDEFPLTSNGKLDKKNLPLPSSLGISLKNEYVAPRSELESEIASVVGETLGVEKVGVKDNFFELGGHSILAIKVVSKLREIFGVELELKNLFENPTVEGLSESIILEQSKFIDDDELDSLLEQVEKME